MVTAVGACCFDCSSPAGAAGIYSVWGLKLNCGDPFLAAPTALRLRKAQPLPCFQIPGMSYALIWNSLDNRKGAMMQL